MKNIQREDIHILNQHSNLSEEDIAKVLREKIYHDSPSWQTFLRVFFLTLGIGFTLSGIVFFFAYNWTDLHKFIKLGIIEALLIITTIIAFWPQITNTVKKIILTVSSVLVGLLFAVFGQIYQTGANAYDFFLAWTLCITLWVAVSNFAPLWLLYLLLLNTTLILFDQQVASNWSGTILITLLFLLNSSVLIATTLIQRYKRGANIPNYFLNMVALAALTFGTLGIVEGIFKSYQPAFGVLILSCGIGFATGIWYGLKINSGFYLSTIPLSLIIIIAAVLLKISEKESMYLLVSLFIIISITFVTRNLINMHRKQMK